MNARGEAKLIPPGLSRTVLTWAVWSAAVLALGRVAAHLPGEYADPWGAGMGKPPALARWDAGWYYGIAVNGYQYDASHTQNSVGFYPLYPLVVRSLVALFHTPVFWTGIVFSLVCLFAALLVLWELAVLWDPRLDPGETVETLLFFPTAFFFAAFYTESFFLLTTAAALWGARRGRWLLAGLAGAAASATRLNGVFVLLPIAWCAARSFSATGRRLRAGPVFAVLATLAGFAAFPVYLWRRFGDPLLYFRAKMTGWPARLQSPLDLILTVLRSGKARLLDPGQGGQIRFWLEVTALVGFTLLAVGLFRRKLWPEALYCAGSLLLFWCNGTLDANQRYVLGLFPCFFVLAAALRRSSALAFAYRFAGAGLGMFLLTRFVRWIFVA